MKTFISIEIYTEKFRFSLFFGLERERRWKVF